MIFFVNYNVIICGIYFNTGICQRLCHKVHVNLQFNIVNKQLRINDNLRALVIRNESQVCAMYIILIFKTTNLEAFYLYEQFPFCSSTKIRALKYLYLQIKSLFTNFYIHTYLNLYYMYIFVEYSTNYVTHVELCHSFQWQCIFCPPIQALYLKKKYLCFKHFAIIFSAIILE